MPTTSTSAARSVRAATLATGMTLFAVASGSPVPAAAQTTCQPPTGPADSPAVTGGDGGLSAPQPGPAPAETPIRCWVGASGDAVLGVRAIAIGDLIVTFSDLNEVVAFPSDGSETWRVPVGQHGQGFPGGLDTDGRLVFAAAPVGLVALDPTDGSEAWSVLAEGREIAGAFGAQSPVAIDDHVYAVLNTSGDADTVDRWLLALDAAGGEELWRVALAPTLPSGPIAADASTVVLTDGMGTVRAFEPADGTERWSVPVEELGLPPRTPITLQDDRLVAGLADGRVVALSTEDGSRLWEFIPDSGLTVAVTLQGDVVIVNAVTHIYAIGAADGQPRWSTQIQEQVPPFEYQPVPAVVDDLVIVGTTDVSSGAALVALDLGDGSERWRSTTEMFGALLSPIVVSGRVYVPAFDVNQDGGLYAFGMPG